jgi:hypothetical protein
MCSKEGSEVVRSEVEGGEPTSSEDLEGWERLSEEEVELCWPK